MPTISARLVCAATLVAIGIAGCRDEPTALPESPGSALETSASDQPPTTADGLPAEWRDSIIAYTGSDSSSQASSASVEGGAVGGPSLAVIAGMPDLRDACGSTVTGVAFDGTYIYVAEGGNQNMCIGRFSASGALVDFKRFSPDFRGLTYVP